MASRTKDGLTYNFNPNAVNGLTNVTRSGTMTVVGFATNTPASVTVNGQSATLYGATFAAPGVTLSNGPNTFTAIAQDIYGRKATNIITANYPATLTASNDANGNLLSDGKRTFEYDAENRLTNFYVATAWRTSLAYDGLSRMRIRREYTWTNSAWKLTNEVRLIYDGLLVLQERDSNNIPKVTYTRGVDLSGSLQDAGGIGGMLGMTTHTNTTNCTHYFYHSDGAGNITALMDTNQVVQAQYAYEPFGNLWSQSGALTNLSRYESGTGTTPIRDKDGTIVSPGDAVLRIGEAVPEGFLNAVAMVPFGGEVRALSVPWAKSAAAGPLIAEFRNSPHSAHSSELKWSIGNALEIVADESVLDDLIELVQDKQNGQSREMLVCALGNMKNPRAVDLLLELLDDEEVAGHALIALGKLKAQKARPKIEAFLNHPKAGVRKEAKRTLAKLEKQQ